MTRAPPSWSSISAEDSDWRTVSSIASRETISDKINRLIRRELDAFFTLCP
ncbi:MAG: hypothetical protein HFG79_09190 [Lachnospiraceae bacterium]|nr:hypothetical protein [Lachnospiraceae bacterium]